MKKNKSMVLHRKVLTTIFTGVILILVSVVACKEQDFRGSTTTSITNITGYLREHPDQFSEYTKILKLTGNEGFLGAYGLYTCFVPNNDAIREYLTAKDVASIEDIPPGELKSLIRFHTLKDTISTKLFTDGKMNKPTMFGQYLITGASNIDGASFIRVNRQANILQGNIRCGNGLIHVIDEVMQPASQTLAQMIEGNSDYSIFTQALKATGFYDTLNVGPLNPGDSVTRWCTLIAETNQVFAANGLDTYDKFFARYCKTGNPKNPLDSMFIFVAYHILPDIKYIADILSASSHPTKAPLEVITSRLDGERVLLNSDFVNGIQEPGAQMDRDKSDVSATNGAFHTALQNFTAKIRKPVPVYWDVADQPELRKMTSDFRKPNKAFEIAPGTLKDVYWLDNSSNFGITHIQYATQGVGGSDKYVYGDRLTVNFRPDIINNFEFTTPLLARGKYKVWICYRRTLYNDFQAFFDGVPLARLFGLNPAPSYPGGTDAEAESAGWKRYTSPVDNNFLGRLIGTVDVKTTDRHKFKIISLTTRGGANGNAFLFDMIHFIPVDKPQVLPRFDINGKQIFQ